MKTLKNCRFLLPVLLIFCFLLSACTGNPVSTVTTGTESEPAAGQDSETTVTAPATDLTSETEGLPELPDDKFSGIFNILIKGDSWSPATAIYQEEASDIASVDAVWRRCDRIKNQYGVEISVVPDSDTVSKLRRDVKSGDNAFDAVITYMPAIAACAANGTLMDLQEVDGIDLSQPYWDQSSVKSLSIGNKLFYAASDIITTDDDATWTMLFNKKMAEKYDIEDLYQVVRDGRWTFDYFYSLIKEGISEDNGDNVWDHLDTYAFASHRDMSLGFFYGAGLTFVSKDADNLPYIDNSNAEKIQKVLEYSLSVMRENHIALDGHKWLHVNNTTLVSLDAFSDGRALFFCDILYHVIGLRSMNTDFGILPLPKYDEKQEEYITFVNPAASLVGVPIYQKNNNNARRSGVILEAMAYYGHELIMPEYIERAIKNKSTRDPDSKEMIDILLNNRVYDLGLINDWGGISSEYENLVFNNQSDFASMYKKREKSAKNALTKFLNNIEKLK